MQANKTIRALPNPNTNGKASGTQESLPQRRTLDIISLLQGETSVTAKTRDGEPAVIRVPHSLLAVLVTITLAVVGAGIFVVRTLTRLEERTANIQSQQVVLGRMLETETAYVSAQTNRINFMVGLMSKDQQDRLFNFDKRNPMPERPKIVTPEKEESP